MTKTGVEIVINDQNGDEFARFPGYDNMSIVQMAERHDVEMPVSCCSGACFVCCAKIEQGVDKVQIDKTSIPLVDIEFDENNNPKEILTCIGGIKSECFKDGKFHEIVLKKLL